MLPGVGSIHGIPVSAGIATSLADPATAAALHLDPLRHPFSSEYKNFTVKVVY